MQAEGSMLYKRLFVDFDNAYTKESGFANLYAFEQSFGNFKFFGSLSDQKVDRLHPVLRTPIETLEVQKYALALDYALSNATAFKVRYITISDNIAPTDGGRVYGLGVNHNINNYNLETSIYRGLYEGFGVNQYEVGLYRKISLGELKGQVGMATGFIDLNGGDYGSYNLEDTHYSFIILSTKGKYKKYFFGADITLGERLFGVLGDGKSVEHHAMLMKDTYHLNVGKKIDRFDIILGYLYRDSKELPNDRSGVKTTTWSLALKYNY
jgi:hypothetical protein